MTDEDYHGPRNTAMRVQLTKTREKGNDNISDHELTGRDGEEYTEVMRVQSHGFASVPPNGSHAVAVALGGRHDAVIVLGGEHVDHKPNDLGDGNTAHYNAAGAILKLIGKTAELSGIDSFVIKVSGVTVTIDGNGLTVKGGEVRHNSKSIGDTHGHVSAPPGSPGPPV